MNENSFPPPEYDPQEPRRGSGRSSRVVSIVVVAAILIAGLGLRGLLRYRPVGSGGDMSCDVTQQYESIRIQTVSCDVDIDVGTNDTSSVEYRGPSRMVCTAEVHNGTLVIEEKSAGRWLSLRNLFSFRNWESKLTVYLPEREYKALSVETVSGDVEIPRGGVFRVLDLATISGEIELAGTEESDVTAETVSGDVNIRSGSMKSLTVGTTSGELSATNVSVYGPAEFNSVSGDIDFLYSDAASLTVSAISGDVHTAILTPMEYITHTTSGEVSVAASQPGAGSCRITTTSGDILCE